MEWMEIPESGVLAVPGFAGAAASCGIKTPGSPKLDLALLTAPPSTVAAATFTTNRVQASPVRLCREHVEDGDIRAVIVNSGNANACNGSQGDADARAMAETAARALELAPEQVFVCSTGVIGVPMPMERILPRIDPLARQLGPENDLALAQAIMTSDTVPKRRALRFEVDGTEVKLGGMAKGAGMIHPGMATMLCYVVTDARIELAWLRGALRRAVERSFNRISVDGDMSTNDTVLVLAGGTAGNAPLDGSTPGAERFEAALSDLLLSLAKMIVRDGERVSKFVELRVGGAASEGDALRAARAVANSFLVKAAWNGGRAYWGRIMDALGYSGAEFDPDRAGIWYDDLQAVRAGSSAGTAQDLLDAVTARPEFRIRIDLGAGDDEATVYTSDISQGFIEFNQRE